MHRIDVTPGESPAIAHYQRLTVCETIRDNAAARGLTLLTMFAEESAAFHRECIAAQGTETA